jgi:hypothetical protein
MGEGEGGGDCRTSFMDIFESKKLDGLKFRRQEPIGKYIHPPLNPLPSREGKVVCDTPIKGWESTHLK